MSAITTKRAYADLEEAGLIETVPGKGAYVAGGNAELIREEQMREVEGLMARDGVLVASALIPLKLYEHREL